MGIPAFSHDQIARRLLAAVVLLPVFPPRTAPEAGRSHP
jgi:hypothetical protein